MKMKKLLKLALFLFAYLTISMAMESTHGCDHEVAEKTVRTRSVNVGEASRDDYQKKVMNLSLGRKLASGPSRRGCGH
ncbi:unnamed protein product [Cochlearia groenlandica]